MNPSSAPLRAAQIVVGALAGGLVVATLVAVFLRTRSEAQAADPALLNALVLMVALLFASTVTIWTFLRKRLLSSLAEHREDALATIRAGQLPLPLYTITILGCALFEAPGLLGVVALFLGGPWYMLTAPVLSIALILRQFPTPERLADAVRDAER